MKSYSGWNATIYNRLWRTFTQRTLTETTQQIDIANPRGIQPRQGREPRLLDIACGTGILLLWLVENIPAFLLWPVVEWIARRVEEGHVRAYTVAEAEAMCTQAELSVVRKSTFVVNWLWHGWTLCLQKDESV